MREPYTVWRYRIVMHCLIGALIALLILPALVTAAPKITSRAGPTKAPAAPETQEMPDVDSLTAQSQRGSEDVRDQVLMFLVRELVAERAARRSPSVGGEVTAADMRDSFLAIFVPKVLIGIIVVLLLILVLRFVIARQLWDSDVQGNAYASAIVLSATILGFFYYLAQVMSP